jgi:hypothetical protein
MIIRSADFQSAEKHRSDKLQFVMHNPDKPEPKFTTKKTTGTKPALPQAWEKSLYSLWPRGVKIFAFGARISFFRDYASFSDKLKTGVP